jgi:tetratricopeptide (TPR) repeat protein
MDSRAYHILAVATIACLSAFHVDTFATGLRDEAVAYREAGYERQQQGDLDGALTAYQKAAELDPSYPVPHNDVGVIYEQRGEVERAKQAYERALAIDPDYPDAHANAALLAEQVGDKTAAVAHWMKRYQLGTTDDVWTARAGEHLVALGAMADLGLKGQRANRRHLEAQAFQAHEQSLKDYDAVTKRWRNP